MVRSQLLLSEALMLKWQPVLALTRAEEALKHIAEHADKMNATLVDNDETERFALSATLWLMARMQAVRCTAQLHHLDQAYRLISTTLSEAAAVNEHLLAASLLHIQAGLQMMEGATAAALNTHQDVLARYQTLCIRDLRVADLLLDSARLRDRLGLREDSERMVGAALVYLTTWTSDLGLNEMKEHPEFINIYSSGTALFAHALLHSARCKVRRRQLDAAQQDLEHALLLLRRHTRCLPTQHATTVLALGRVLRLQALMETKTPPAPPPSLQESASLSAADVAAAAAEELRQAAQLTAACLSRAQELMVQTLTLATLDSGHQHAVIREALLELSTLAVASASVPRAAACLKLAHVATSKAATLLSSSHTLVPVAVAQLPPWLTTFIKAQEAFFSVSQGKPADSPVSDADVGRMAVCRFLALTHTADLAPGTALNRLSSQRVLLHSALAAACPKYVSDACFPDVPLPPAEPPAPAAGTVVVQWYPQPDGCWQAPRSWDSAGSLAGSQLSDCDVMTLRPVGTYAAMLFVVCGPGGSVQYGEASFEVDAVRALQRRVKALRHRLESPRAKTDIFGDDAPSAEELQRARAAAERFLSQRRTSEDGAAPAVSSPLGREGSMGAPGSMLYSDGPDDSFAGSPRHSYGGDGEMGGPPPVGPPTDVHFLRRLEAMLSLEGGVDITDEPFAGWLQSVLPGAE